MELQDPVQVIHGIGDKTAEGLNKLNIVTVQDLISYYPRRYTGYDPPVLIRDAAEFDRVTVEGEICTDIRVNKGPRYTITTLSVRDKSGSAQMVWFNSPYLRNSLKKGNRYLFTGTLRIKGKMRVMEMPEVFTPEKYRDMQKVLQPIYPLGAGVKNYQLRKAIQGAEALIRSLPDNVPEEIRQRYDLLTLPEAVQNVHFPVNTEILRKALKRLAYDEFVSFLLSVQEIRRECMSSPSSFCIREDAEDRLRELLGKLPYSLTNGQQDALEDIIMDMSGGYVMNRMIQGDVGCGKTILAAAALYMAAVSGWQGALMVPTEVLAMQHFHDLTELFRDTGVKTALLVGSLSAKEKREIRNGIRDGSVDIIIGTHALIQESVEYRNLGIVVTDEQHRFGVRQRERLSEKGDMPHVLVMSATPIPRSLAMIIYADLDISLVTELPGGRKRVLNCVVGTDYRPTAYRFILGEIMKGHQAYVICPKVEDSEGTELENVVSYAEQLRELYGDSVRVGYLHGRMKEEEKSRILLSFRDREIKVLVSTTVIEVGINNPNATVMMIENAERFGLAQLHQLRGRVGRGEDQSYCIFINVNRTEESVERLKVLEESNDGFHIAAEDLRLRGPGDFFGVRQSGEIMFRVADIYDHADMLKAAQETVLMSS